MLVVEQMKLESKYDIDQLVWCYPPNGRATQVRVLGITWNGSGIGYQTNCPYDTNMFTEDELFSTREEAAAAYLDEALRCAKGWLDTLLKRQESTEAHIRETRAEISRIQARIRRRDRKKQ